MAGDHFGEDGFGGEEEEGAGGRGGGWDYVFGGDVGDVFGEVSGELLAGCCLGGAESGGVTGCVHGEEVTVRVEGELGVDAYTTDGGRERQEAVGTDYGAGGVGESGLEGVGGGRENVGDYVLELLLAEDWGGMRGGLDGSS